MSKVQRARLTLSLVNAMQPGEIIRDAEVSGFGVRRRKGTPSYFLQTRINGRLKWITIGKHGQPWTTTQARTQALALLKDIGTGGDPVVQKQRLRNESTLAETVPEFLADHGAKLKPSTYHEYDRVFRNEVVPAIGGRRIRDVARGDINRIHNAMKQRPRMANVMLAVVSKFMNWCELEGLREQYSNPCRMIKRYPETQRQRYLSQDEFMRLGDVLRHLEATGAESPYAIAAVRLLLQTGARLGEILTLEWRFVDLERGVIFLPDSKTGQRAIFLNSSAVQTLAALPSQDGNPYVIVGTVEGGHLINLQKPWRRIRQEVGIDDVRLHDLRHSFASIAAGQGASLQVIGSMLGHKNTQTTERYAHLVADHVREANEHVGRAIDDMFQRKKTERSSHEAG